MKYILYDLYKIIRNLTTLKCLLFERVDDDKSHDVFKSPVRKYEQLGIPR